MKLFKNKDNKKIAEAQQDLSEFAQQLEEQKDFFRHALRVLLVFLKDFTLDLQEIDSNKFKKDIDALTEKILSEEKTSPVKKLFEKYKKIIPSFVKRQKKYLFERENEFKDIIDLLTQAMASLDTDNTLFNQKVYEQSEKIEKITLLGDIKTIKKGIKQEVSNIRKAVKEKQEQDRKKIQRLSVRVNTLNNELEKAQSESLKDALTGIYNRKAFDIELTGLIEKNITGKRSFSLLMLDIDDFKTINDTYGHQTGDRVLVTLAHKLQENIRKGDMAARYGGEEFAIIFPGASHSNALKKAKKICRMINSTRFSENNTQDSEPLSFSVSIGVSSYKKNDTAATVTERADKALYAAKHAGKNRVVSEKFINTRSVPVGRY